MDLNDALFDLMWYIIRPPHTACFSLDDKGTRRRVGDAVLDAPLCLSGFPEGGLHIAVPTDRSAETWRKLPVAHNTIRAALLAIYLFYWTPIGTPSALANIPSDHSGYHRKVMAKFSSGGQPVWAELIGRDYTRDPDTYIAEERRQLVLDGEGYCDGLVWFTGFKQLDARTLELECSS